MIQGRIRVCGSTSRGLRLHGNVGKGHEISGGRHARLGKLYLHCTYRMS